MPISLAGTLNTTALTVPALYVQIVPPAIATLNGVPSNVIGFVGTAPFGPVNTPVVLGSYAQYVQTFGQLSARKYDMGTHVYIAAQQGANAFTCVRVTDGTDAAASNTITNGAKYASLWTGSLGNQLTVVRSTASSNAANTWKVTIGLPGQVPEVFDNIAAANINPTTGSAFANYWAAEQYALANGNASRGPSQIVSSTPQGTFAATAAAGTYTLSGGTDGAGLSSTTNLVGSNGMPKTGMYSLSGQGISILDVCDDDTPGDWTTIGGFALSEACMAVHTIAAGTTVSNGPTVRSTAALDDPWSVLLHGDWIYWSDPVAKVVRKVSPQSFYVGRAANLAPNQSPLNKPIYGVISTERLGTPGTLQANHYSFAELSFLFQSGIDVITSPSPGGQFVAARLGHNSSSDASRNGVNYTRMINYLATTLNAGMGIYIGQVITPNLFKNIKSTLVNYLENLRGQGLIANDVYGNLPYSVICDGTNNPPSRTALGYVQADVNVQFEGINEKFIINLQGGTTVVIAQQSGINVSTQGVQ